MIKKTLAVAAIGAGVFTLMSPAASGDAPDLSELGLSELELPEADLSDLALEDVALDLPEAEMVTGLLGTDELQSVETVAAPAAPQQEAVEAPAPMSAVDGETVNVGLVTGNIGNNWCAAPWHWEGPLTALNLGSDYKACESPVVGDGDADIRAGGVTSHIGNNWCAAPWNWEGPLTTLNGPAPYLSCNMPRA